MLPKRLIALSVFAALALASAVSLRAQWVQTNGPGIPVINAFSRMGSTLLAGSAGSGIFQSTNGGLNWQPMVGEPGDRNVISLAIIGKDLFALGGSDIYRSTDGGFAWTDLNQDFQHPYTLLAAYGDMLFVGTAHTGTDGVLCSSDHGVHWSHTAGFWRDVAAIGFSGKYGFYGGFQGVYSSSDSGRTWKETALSDNVTALSIANAVIWAGTSSGGIYRSSDFGINWTRLNTVPGNPVSAMASVGSTIIAGTSIGIIRSSDNGVSWSSPQLSEPRALCVFDTVLFASTKEGVFRSTNQGSSWQNANTGIMGSSCINIAVSDSNIFTAVGQNLYRSTDIGSRWSLAMQSSYLNIFYLTTVDSFILVYNQANLYRQKFNGGSGWQDITGALPTYTMYLQRQPVQVTVIVLGLAAVGRVFFAQTDVMGIIRSTDYGSTWTSVNVNTSLGSFAILDTIIYASVSGTIYRSSDYGSHWTKMGNGVPSSTSIVALGVCRGSFLASTKEGIYRSTDSGTTWTLQSNDIADSNITCFVTCGSTIFSENANAINYSPNDGESWFQAVAGLSKSIRWGRIAANDKYLFVGTDGLGVWKRSLTDFIASSNSAQTIGSLSVFPNPLVGSTKILFKTVAQGTVTIKIFNSIGKEVSTVFQGELESGEHSVVWTKPTELANGAFVCEVSMNGQSKHSLLIVAQ